MNTRYKELEARWSDPERIFKAIDHAKSKDVIESRTSSSHADELRRVISDYYLVEYSFKLSGASLKRGDMVRVQSFYAPNPTQTEPIIPFRVTVSAVAA